MNKAKLIELLAVYEDNAEIVTQTGESFNHIVNLTDGSVVISTEKPIGTCNRSGGYVYPTTTKGYSGYCPEIGEDLYEMEFTKYKE